MELIGSKIILKHKHNNTIKIIRYYDWMSLTKLYWLIYIMNIVLFSIIMAGFGNLVILILQEISGLVNLTWLMPLALISLIGIILGPGIISSLSTYKSRVRRQILIFLLEGYKIINQERCKAIVSQYFSIPVFNDIS